MGLATLVNIIANFICSAGLYSIADYFQELTGRRPGFKNNFQFPIYHMLYPRFSFVSVCLRNDGTTLVKVIRFKMGFGKWKKSKHRKLRKKKKANEKKKCLYSTRFF